MPIPLVVPAAVAAAKGGAGKLLRGAVSRLKTAGGRSSKTTKTGTSAERILSRLERIERRIGGPKMYFYAEDEGMFSSEEDIFNDENLLFDDGYDDFGGRKRPNISIRRTVDALKTAYRRSYERGKERWRAAQARKAARREAISRASIPEIIDFERKRAALRNDLRKVKINIALLKRRARLAGLSSETKLVLSTKLQDLERRVKNIESSLKGTRPFNDSSSAPTVVMTVPQASAALDRYKSDILAVQKELEQINEVVLGRRLATSVPSLVEQAIKIGVVDPSRPSGPSTEAAVEKAPTSVPETTATAPVAPTEASPKGWGRYLPIILGGLILLGIARRR